MCRKAFHSSKSPRIPHHEDEIDIVIDGGADSAVIVQELLFGDLAEEEEVTRGEKEVTWEEEGTRERRRK